MILTGGQVVHKTAVLPLRRASHRSLVNNIGNRISGLSGTKFAALAGVKFQTFAFWAQRRRRQRGSAPVAAKTVDSVRWLEAVVEGAKNPSGQSPAAIVLHLPGGARVEVADEKQALLAAVMIRALARPC
jgi:hypothetical protein